MKVFVTGGSGFVGGHVIEALTEAHEVYAMARSEGSARKVEALGATAVRTDLEGVAAAHLEGMDAVVHAAAYVEEYGPREIYWRINVDGTQRLLDAARDAGVRRFVHVSSNASVFENRHQLDVDEATPYPTRSVFHYADSKAEAERRVLGASREGFVTVALRPCFVWGPRDNSVLPALRRMVADGGFVWLDRGAASISTTHVANLVEGVARALVGGRGGEAYFLADEGDVTVREFIGGLAASDQLELPDRSLPGALVRGAAWGLEGVWRLLGRTDQPPVSHFAASVMSTSMTVRTDKARDELGWRPVVGREAGLRGLTGSAPTRR